MTGRQTVSACLIVRDEEERLPACLRSVAFCDQIVVVDGGSSDRTLEIAREAGALVVENPWPGFAAQRNVALDHATCAWVLEIDADERVTPELRDAIEEFLAAPPAGVDVACMPRRNWFLGARLSGAAKYPDYRARLFRRGLYRHDESRAVHEGLWPAGPAHPLSGDLDHELAGSLREALADTVAYARLEAGRLGRPAPLPALAGILVRPPLKALYRLVVDAGWSDGPPGVLRIALDSVSDALTWAFALARRGAGGPPARGHFGLPDRLPGPVRLVGVASGQERSRAAADWLRHARAAGADVALLTDSPAVADGLRVASVGRFMPLTFLRALSAEHTLRPVDALVVAGRRERMLARLAPAQLRGMGVIDLGLAPAEAERLVRGERR